MWRLSLPFTLKHIRQHSICVIIPIRAQHMRQKFSLHYCVAAALVRGAVGLTGIFGRDTVRSDHTRLVATHYSGA